MTVPVVIITGKKGSGKDTFGRLVCKACGKLGNYEVIDQLFFAEPLKTMVQSMFGLSRDACFGDIEAKESNFAYGKSARHWLQWFGTEVFREQVHPDFWVHHMLRRIINPGRSITSGYVITDCRFPNEWVLLSNVLEGRQRAFAYGAVPPGCDLKEGQSFKCFLVKVTRPGFEDRGDMHVSETSVDLLDKFEPMVIVNDGGLEDLEAKARAFVKEKMLAI
jgi:hypothetical protein